MLYKTASLLATFVALVALAGCNGSPKTAESTKSEPKSGVEGSLEKVKDESAIASARADETNAASSETPN